MRRLHEIAGDREGKPFMLGAEIVTTRGSIEAPATQRAMSIGQDLADWDEMDWISITDNAGGNPQIDPSILGRKIMEMGTDVVVHMTCKDRNRNALESTAWYYASEGLDNILALTGDFPIDGFEGRAVPVFDIDSSVLIKMLAGMNKGLEVAGRKKGTTVELTKTNFFVGCTVSPFKSNEAELICQYLKLELKLKNGAHYIIPQIGYDMRKSAELLIFLRECGYDVPVFGNVYVLSKAVAGLFNNQRIPGCVVTNKLLEDCTKAAKDKDKGKSFFLELAAKQVACFRGLGYRGAYFGGFRSVDDLHRIVEIADSYAADDWKSFAKDIIYPDGDDFYLYARDEKTGLANPEEQSPERIAAANSVDDEQISSMYHVNKAVHDLVFDPKAPFFKAARGVYKFLEKHPTLGKAVHWNERVAKNALFNCKNCGHCSLSDSYYTCPGSGCRKGQRNGPCGGSRGPLCESADVPCIWYKAYHRAKKAGNLDRFLKRNLIIRDHRLNETSGWANYFLGRDHAEETAEGAEPADEGKKAAETPEKATEKTAEAPAEAAEKTADPVPAKTDKSKAQDD